MAISDGGCTTGFGIVAHELYSRWVKRGHSVDVLAINYRGDPWPADYRLWTTYGNDVYGGSRIVEMLNRIKPDVVFILNDLPIINKYLFNNPYDPNKELQKYPIMLYVPVDCKGLPPSWINPIKATDGCAVQSYWGQQVIKEEYGLDVDVCWHSMNKDNYFKISEEHSQEIQATFNGKSERLKVRNKEEAKEAMHLKDKFIVLNVNRNSQRKNLGDTIRIFSEFAQDKEDAFLYLHTLDIDNGINLYEYIERFKIAGKIGITPKLNTFVGIEPQALNIFYNMADVFLTTSWGEGFGVSAAEALATGLPVIATDFSAMTEVVGEGGILVPPSEYILSGTGVDLALPDRKGMLKALNDLYYHKDKREELSEKALHHAEDFSWDIEADKLFNLIQKAVKKHRNKLRMNKVIGGGELKNGSYSTNKS